MGEQNDSFWDRVQEKLEQMKVDEQDKAHHSSTETDNVTNKTDSHTVHIPSPEKPSWLDTFVTAQDTEAERRKTKIAMKKQAESILDMAENTRIKRKGEENQQIIDGMEWCAPYDSERDYQRDVTEYLIEVNELDSAKEDSVDQRIRDHILHTINEELIPDLERINTKEEFLHKTLIAYLGFCKFRIGAMEECGMPDEIKKPIYEAYKQTYGLAFKAVIASVVLRNSDARRKLGSEEFKKLWDKEGVFRERSTKVIDELRDNFAEYFRSASMDERSNYNHIMQSEGMTELIEKIEKDTGIIGYASEIPSAQKL